MGAVVGDRQQGHQANMPAVSWSCLTLGTPAAGALSNCTEYMGGWRLH